MSKQATGKESNDNPQLKSPRAVPEPSAVGSSNNLPQKEEDHLPSDVIPQYRRNPGIEDPDAIYNSFDESLCQPQDEAASFLIKRLKQKIQETQLTTPKKDEICNALLATEKKAFQTIYLGKANVRKYFADTMQNDQLVSEVAIMIKAQIETKAIR
jgi:hypothetical protein